MKKNTYNKGIAAHYRDKTVVMPDTFELREDYDSPRTYLALRGDRYGYPDGTGRRVRVRVDHDATGTGTTGTGDTVVWRA